MKLLIMPRSIDQAVSLIEHIDGMIVGLKNMSVNMPSYYSYDEIVRFVNIAKKFNKEIFVSLNKNMFNEDLSGENLITYPINKEFDIKMQN